MGQSKLFSLLFFFIFIFSASPQAKEIVFGNYDIKLRYLKGDYNNSTKISEKIEGSPFLDDNFTLGFLYFEGKDPITVPMRYHIVNEEIQVRIEGDVFVVQEDVEIKLKEDHYQLFKYKDKVSNSLLKGFFKVLSPVVKDENDQSNKVVLLEKPVKKVRSGQKAAAMKTPTPGKYLDRSYFYLKFPRNDIAVASESNRKDFVLAFPEEHREKLSRFLKDNKLKPQKHEDLEKIITFYNASIL